jgi:putative CocE/NonD family hydrolase
VIVESNVVVPMRDGMLLRADVYRPDGDATGPAILGRTPYDRTFGPTPPSIVDPERAVAAGIALVCMDVRGQHGSDGEFHPFRAEGADGYDSVEWVAAQDWCDGAVAMAGRSYAAATQWLAAAARPPHLRAIAPVVVGSNYFDGWVYQGGAFQLGFNLFWVQIMAGRGKRTKLEEQYKHLPLRTAPLVHDSPSGRFYREWLDHPTLDEHWRALSIDARYHDVEVPAFNIGGWYDIFLGGTLENFSRMRREAGSERARSRTRLLVGPWAHGSTYGAYPDHSFETFSKQDSVDLTAAQLEFLGQELFGPGPEEAPATEASTAEAAPPPAPGAPAPVRIFVMGVNRWRDEPDWPLARAEQQRWFLHSDGDGAQSGGTLTALAPAQEPADVFRFDPRDPAPTIGGPTSLPGRFMRTNAGPLDQRPLEGRADVLSYTTEPLQEELEVTGPLSLTLHAATSAEDADWVAKLCDVEPDGFSRILAEGVLRARFREGLQRECAVEPGRPYEYAIDLKATSNVFLPGHRIRLLVTSSSFPRFDRNAGTGAPPGDGREEDLRTAEQTIFHDGERASHLLLPVIPRG